MDCLVCSDGWGDLSGGQFRSRRSGARGGPWQENIPMASRQRTPQQVTPLSEGVAALPSWERPLLLLVRKVPMRTVGRRPAGHHPEPPAAASPHGSTPRPHHYAKRILPPAPHLPTPFPLRSFLAASQALSRRFLAETGSVGGGATGAIVHAVILSARRCAWLANRRHPAAFPPPPPTNLKMWDPEF